MRIEEDKLGIVEIPENKAYGIQSLRAAENFALNHKKTNMDLIYAIVVVKQAAARTYQDLKIGRDGVYEAIEIACQKVLMHEVDHDFVTEALQGGAGTSTNMNVNEVICNLALKEMGFSYGEYDQIHPLDDVNRGQSTNDVYPTALRITAIQKLRKLSEACAKLQEALQKKESEYDTVAKVARTELMDAIEITLGQEFGAYAQAIARDRWRIYKVEERLRQVNIGGTAIGTGANAQRKYRFKIIDELRDLTDIGLSAAEYPIDITQNNDVFVEVSGLLKALAVNLMKISNDLRLMNSGPSGGFSEIRLKPLQTGSSIMPGKVNPVIPEMVMQAAMKVMANDAAISMAAAHGEFELNAFLPLIADSLLESLELLTNTTELFLKKCIMPLKANIEKCKENLENSFAFATAYTEKLGYDSVAEIIKDVNYDVKIAKRILEEKAKEMI